MQGIAQSLTPSLMTAGQEQNRGVEGYIPESPSFVPQASDSDDEDDDSDARGLRGRLKMTLKVTICCKAVPI